MSRAYPTITADTPAEVNAWADKTIQKVKLWDRAELTHDTGIVQCRLMPIFPTKEVGRELWWPMPMEMQGAC